MSNRKSSSGHWSKTDDLDLVAIAHALRNNKATESRLAEGLQQQLRVLTRARRSEIRKRSILRMVIRTIMDVVWREFQGFAEHRNGRVRKVKVFSDLSGKRVFISFLFSMRPELMPLRMKMQDLRAFDAKVSVLEKEIESLLLQTDGRLLLTVPGLGVSTVAELYAEIGEVSHYHHAGRLIKKAGTNPIVKH